VDADLLNRTVDSRADDEAKSSDRDGGSDVSPLRTTLQSFLAVFGSGKDSQENKGEEGVACLAEASANESEVPNGYREEANAISTATTTTYGNVEMVKCEGAEGILGGVGFPGACLEKDVETTKAEGGDSHHPDDDTNRGDDVDYGGDVDYDVVRSYNEAVQYMQVEEEGAGGETGEEDNAGGGGDELDYNYCL
jgi:hypothetical protein